MPDLLCEDVCLWIKHVGCGVTRTALLGLEPGSRIWLEVEGEPILFERMQDGTDGRSTRGLKAISETAGQWMRLYREQKGRMIEFDFIERPLDAGCGADRTVGPRA